LSGRLITEQRGAEAIALERYFLRRINEIVRHASRLS
jgi:hypothetical protein